MGSCQTVYRFWLNVSAPKFTSVNQIIMCKVSGSSVWDQCDVPASGLSGKFGSTCVVDGPNTWEASDGHGPGDVRVGWRIRIEGLVA